MNHSVTLANIIKAKKRVDAVIRDIPLQFSDRLSKEYEANVYLKREDLQEVRSYKIRGAYNLINSLSPEAQAKGVVCASAGNHAQGVALSCQQLQINGTIFVPEVTPRQKINKIKDFGGEYITLKMKGKDFDAAQAAAQKFCTENNMTFVHPFDDPATICGQGTVGLEIYEELADVDYVLAPVGGGGLISGVSSYLKEVSPETKIIAVEPTGAASLHTSLKAGKVVSLNKVNTFVDGCAVKTIGQHGFDIAQKLVDQSVLVDEGDVATTMIELYQQDGIIAEPGGALSIAGLENVRQEIKGKNVVCILSGGNNDISRYPEIVEKSLVSQGLKHYFIINFAQNPGQLKNLLNNVLGPNDDIVRFEYIKRTNKEMGPALVGIELSAKDDLHVLVKNMQTYKINYQLIESSDILYGLLI